MSPQEREGVQATGSDKAADASEAVSDQARRGLVAASHAVAAQGGTGEVLLVPCSLVDAVDSIQFLPGVYLDDTYGTVSRSYTSIPVRAREFSERTG